MQLIWPLFEFASNLGRSNLERLAPAVYRNASKFRARFRSDPEAVLFDEPNFGLIETTTLAKSMLCSQSLAGLVVCF